MNKKLFLLLIIVVIVISGCTNFAGCSKEGKSCGDGTIVGRVPPNCEFAPCPDSQIKEETTATLNQKILNGGIYITPLEIVEDSRCPPDVTCVWAGQVTLKVRLEKEKVSKEVVLWQRTPVTFEGNEISFVGVIPENKIKPPVDYRFKFKVVSLSEQGTVEGRVTASQACPVERMPPEPQCAPKPYATPIRIITTERIIEENIYPEIVKTIESDDSGVFKTKLFPGTYELWALPEDGPPIWSTCDKVTVIVKSGQTTNANISCITATESDGSIPVKLPSEFSLREGQTAKVLNNQEMRITLNLLLQYPLCDINGTVSHCPSYVKVTVSSPGGCGPNADPRCLGPPGYSNEHEISVGETVEFQGVTLKLFGVSWSESGDISYLVARFKIEK